MPKKGNGNDLVPRILQGIRDDMKHLREDMNRGFARVDQRLQEVNQRLDATNERIDGTNRRLDGVVEIAGGHWRDHEDRIKTLEQRVDRLER